MKLKLQNKNITGPVKASTLQVPDHLRVRYSIGLDFVEGLFGPDPFDETKAGGFVPSTVTMLTGTPGAGKTTLALQLADSLANQGHVVLYNSGEESLYQVKMCIERLGLAGDFYLGQETSVWELIKSADTLRAEKRPKGTGFFLIQDSIQTLDDEKYTSGTNSMTPLRCTEALTNWAKETFSCVTFIGQVNKDGEFQGKNGMLHAVDARMHISFDKKKKSPTFGFRILELMKSRFGFGETQVLSMTRGGLQGMGTVSDFGESSDD
jgi:DNA repair protein RadA/Sms